MCKRFPRTHPRNRDSISRHGTTQVGAVVLTCCIAATGFGAFEHVGASLARSIDDQSNATAMERMKIDHSPVTIGSQTAAGVSAFVTNVADLVKLTPNPKSIGELGITRNSRPKPLIDGQPHLSRTDLFGSGARVTDEGTTKRIDEAIVQAFDQLENGRAGVITLTHNDLEWFGEDRYYFHRDAVAFNWVKDERGFVTLIDSSDGTLYSPDAVAVRYRRPTGARIFDTGALHPEVAKVFAELEPSSRESGLDMLAGYRPADAESARTYQLLIDYSGYESSFAIDVSKALRFQLDFPPPNSAQASDWLAWVDEAGPVLRKRGPWVVHATQERIRRLVRSQVSDAAAVEQIEAALHAALRSEA